MPVAEIFLSGFITVLFEKLASSDLLNLAHREGIHTQMKNWTGMLLKIQAVLTDAEEKQLKDKAVKLWLDDLQDLAYDLDDILDEFTTEALRRKLTTEPQPSTRRRVSALLPSCCTGLSPSVFMFNSQMRSNIEEISTRLQYIAKQRSELGLDKISGGTSAKTWQRPATTSLIHETCIYGRDEDKREIIKFLLRNESGDNKIGVIPIVGMGGVGKTALAQMVYNDEEVKKHFDLKAWVCVSDEFDAMRITKTILESITSRTCGFKDLDQVQVQLKQRLAGKKFLIVLDDVWNRKYGDWDVLKSPFDDGAQGSKVVVTTRSSYIASIMGTVNYHVLEQLSNDDCWSVFAQHAFKNRSLDANPNLVKIGKEIVEKCGGLPLAARTLGGLLHCKIRVDEWDDVLNSNIWDYSEEESDILPALRLSYHHLPSYLKQCFAYCSILPKDYEFEEEELVFLWMAEGFIQEAKGKKQMEKLGREYFHELLSRSFFQLSSVDNRSHFVMHDLINDLAKFVARDTCFRLEDKLMDQEQYKNLEKARHSSYIQGYVDGILKFETFYKAKHLRTFLPISLTKVPDCYLTNNGPSNLLPKLRCLRVLSLSRYCISELPNSIGGLKHLRYLNLSHTRIQTLPESLGTLYNLQTLTLKGCEYLKKLPTDIGDLINLRHLDINEANSLEEMPLGIGKLVNLQTLSNFVVAKNNGFQIRELGNLVQLKGTLCISGLQNVGDALDAREANLNAKQGLEVLSMVWSDSLDDFRDERVEAEVLDMLQPHKNLKELKVTCYLGLRFPTWMGDPLFSNVVCIHLLHCKNCTSLPPFGLLPSLKDLYIEGMSAVQQVGHEFYGQGGANPFPSLETLTFVNMLEWEYWSNFGVDNEAKPFACLSVVSIRECPKLLGMLPIDLPCLKTLGITKCPQLLVEISSFVLPSLSSLCMRDVSLPNLPMLLAMSNTLESSFLTSLDLKDFSIPNSLCNPSVADEVMLATAMFRHLTSITSLTIENIQKLGFLPKWLTQGLMRLEELKIIGCEELMTLWHNEARREHHLPAFRRMVIEDCHQLVSLVEEEDEENIGQQQQQFEGLPCMGRLEYMNIDNCEKLEKLPQGLHTLVSLRELRIKGCPSLVSFPETGFPSMLTKLVISNCKALQSLSGWIMQKNANNLEELLVSYCPSLAYLIPCEGGLPATLKHLEIWSCEKLEALLSEEGMKINCPSLESILISGCQSLKYLPDALHNHSSLRNLCQLDIRWCDNLEYLPEGWFHPTPTNLRELMIRGCEKLEALLPVRLCNNNNLMSLHRLEIGSCPAGGGIVSYFLERGKFLTNLSSLKIWNIKISKPPSEWSLQRFSSLRQLWIGGPISVAEEEEEEEDEDLEVSSFSFEGMLLPSSLVELVVWNFTSLEKLSFKEFQNLTSLERLWIHNCPRLTSFPKEAMPHSLLELDIDQCPILRQR